jgi:hypothetical protein
MMKNYSIIAKNYNDPLFLMPKPIEENQIPLTYVPPKTPP